MKRQASIRPENQFQFTGPYMKYLGYASMLALVVLSVIFFKERTFFVDIAYQAFLMIKEETLQIQVFRFGGGIVQALPLLAIKLSLPLKVVLLLYSLSYTLFYLLIYFLIVKVLKNEYMGWVLVLLFTLMVYDGFYWAASEIQQGLAVLLLTFAIFQKYPRLEKWWILLLSMVLVLSLAFYHPLIFIPFFYAWVFLLLHDHIYRHKRYYFLGFLMLLFVGLKVAFFGNYYDDGKFSVFFKNLQQYFPDYFSFKSQQKFLASIVKHWYFLPIFFSATAIFQVVKRQWLKLAWMVLSCFAYIMLLQIGSPNATYAFYAEVNYMPLTILIGLPFIFDLIPTYKKYVLPVFLFFAFVMIVRINTIAVHHQPYTQRVNWLAEQMAKTSEDTGSKRLFMTKEKSPMDIVMIEWAVPFESLLLSSLAHPDSAKTILLLPAGRKEDVLKEEDHLIFQFNQFPIDEVDGKYFRLGKGRYEEVGAVGIQ